jgi:hypothetical protein
MVDRKRGDVMPKSCFWLLLVTAFGLPEIASAQSDNAAPDLSGLIECRADTRAWGALAFSLMGDPGAAEALGWKERASDNPFLKEFDLPSQIGVFGRSTSRVAITGTGPMAVLDGVAPDMLAAELGVTPTISTAGKFLGEKLVVESSQEGEGARFHTRITLNVSTVDTHPGVVLAGCSYIVETSVVE